MRVGKYLVSFEGPREWKPWLLHFKVYRGDIVCYWRFWIMGLKMSWWIAKQKDEM